VTPAELERTESLEKTLAKIETALSRIDTNLSLLVAQNTTINEMLFYKQFNKNKNENP